MKNNVICVNRSINLNDWIQLTGLIKSINKNEVEIEIQEMHISECNCSSSSSGCSQSKIVKFKIERKKRVRN